MYDDLCAKDLSKEAKIDIYNEIRAKGYVAAADITPDNLPEIISFINQPSIDDIQREKSIVNEKLTHLSAIEAQNAHLREEHHKTAQENIMVKNENVILRKENDAAKRRTLALLNKPIKDSIRKNACLRNILVYFIAIIVFSAVLYVIIRWLASPYDTLLSRIVSIITIGSYVWFVPKHVIKKRKRKIRLSAIKSFRGKIVKE